MDSQKETTRQNGDQQTDVTRSQNREAAADASGKDSLMEGDNGHHGANETGSHREGAYDKNHQKPTVDNQKPTP